MNFRFYNMPDGSGCEKAICDDNSWYYGQMEDSQPHGLGAYYSVAGDYIKGGYWEYGKLIEILTYEQYNDRMNEFQKDHTYSSRVKIK